MQRGVDGGRARVEIEGGVGQVAHHLVFKLDAAIKPLQRPQLVHIERGKTIELDRGIVAARTLDPEDFDLFAGQRIFLPALGGGIAAAIIGDALVRPKQVGAINKALRLGHGRRFGIVPQVCEALGRGGHW